MDAAQALADLTEISSQIRAAVLFDESGEVAASTLDSQERSRELAQAASELLRTAEGLRTGGDGELTQLEAATAEGSVFVVRQGPRRIVATTSAEPTVGLVFYDLKSCLRGVDDDDPEPAKPRRRTPRKKETEAETQG
jgi:predicted regulator of Ras-like GTPase activity (Roadblock/LC7/MglB family)